MPNKEGNMSAQSLRNKNKQMKDELAIIRVNLKNFGYSDERRPPKDHILYNQWQKVKAANRRASRARKMEK
jgi:hypothetical protein